MPPWPLEDQRPCGKVFCSSGFESQKGLKIIPETMQEAQKEARDGTQRRTTMNLEEVMSRILRGDLLRLRGAKAPHLPFVHVYQR